MNSDDKIIESLITGGLIGAVLGALISENKESGAAVGAIAGAAVLATFKASEQAKKTNLPLVVEEDGKLYEIQPGGGKRFIKNIPKPNSSMAKHFKLK